MPVKRKQEKELEVTAMAFGGRGIARVDGFTVFVDRAVPGDRVRARIVKKKKNYAEAQALEIIESSEDRIEPECRYAHWCGWCRWQCLKYGRQLDYKRAHVTEALEHIGGLYGIAVHPVIPSEMIFGYRNKMEFSFSDRRWLLPDELGRADISKNFALGLHVPGTFDKILDIDACLLQPAEGNRILNRVRDFVKTSDMPPYGLRSHEGFWRFLMLRHSAAEDRWLVNVVNSSENSRTLSELGKSLMAAHDNIAGVVNNITSKKAAVAAGQYEIPVTGTPVLMEKLGKYEFEISANSFFQTNTRQAGKIYDTVRRYAGLSGSETVVDLYTGTGTIPIWLSSEASQITGLELVESAVADAEKNCRNNSVENCRFIAGDIRKSVSGIEKRPDVMVIDPPRAGMHKDVVKAVTDMAPERIVYVSCNPSTLARDISMLSESYRAEEVQPVDMFPHTFHIEAVARLEKTGKSGVRGQRSEIRGQRSEIRGQRSEVGSQKSEGRTDMKVAMEPIGTFYTDAAEIPRHWSISDAKGKIEIDPAYQEGLRDVEKGQQIVVLFYFHKSPEFTPDLLVQKPPHKDRSFGVFSICSPRRPNPIGLSVLKVAGISGNVIEVENIDMIDGTPVLDIKPNVTDAS